MSTGTGPLAGYKVVEFAQVIAGPLAGTLMADLGADVVHVEPPKLGDSARSMGPMKDAHPLWWKVLGRNKRSVTLNLHADRGRELAHQLVAWADVVVVTFRASTVERFELDWESISRINPSAILLQISGYGATSSKRDEPGFGKMGEARSGIVHLTGFENEVPVHTGFSHGDATTGLMGAFAVSAALAKRERDPNRRGEWIDLALHETLFRLVEWQVILHDQLGTIPQRSGNTLAVAPGAVVNTYLSSDHQWITVTSATLRSVLNIVRLLNWDETGFRTAAEQVARKAELDEGLRKWVAAHTCAEAIDAFRQAEVVASPIYDVADIIADETYRERGDIVTIDDADLGPVRMQAVIPHVHTNPGNVWRTGPALGEDNALVYCAWLGLPQDELAELVSTGVI